MTQNESPRPAEVADGHWLFRPLQRLLDLLRPAPPTVFSRDPESPLVPASTESGRQRMFENVQAVLKARNFLRANPSESSRFFSRARESSEARTTVHLKYHKDVVAVWEYLERTHELEFVDLVFHIDGK